MYFSRSSFDILHVVHLTGYSNGMALRKEMPVFSYQCWSSYQALLNIFDYWSWLSSDGRWFIGRVNKNWFKIEPWETPHLRMVLDEMVELTLLYWLLSQGWLLNHSAAWWPVLYAAICKVRSHDPPCQRPSLGPGRLSKSLSTGQQLGITRSRNLVCRWLKSGSSWT